MKIYRNILSPNNVFILIFVQFHLYKIKADYIEIVKHLFEVAQLQSDTTDFVTW